MEREAVQQQEILPLLVIALVTLAAWLSVQNLYVALQWMWQSYEQARRNEQLVVARQVELEQALKALDEATYRVERANYMLGVARNQEEEARRLKQQFAQTISHELRTPLNLIVGFSEMMVQSPDYYGGHLPPAYLRDMSIVYRNAQHLQKLVNDVIDLSRIEAAQMSIVLEEIDVGALVQEAVNTARSLVESRGLDLIVKIEPNLPALWVDPTRIRQVFFNLLNNAARFTDRGNICDSFSCRCRWTWRMRRGLMGPLFYLTGSEENRTLALALSYFSGANMIGPQLHLLMAAASVTLIPPLLVFVIAQRQFVTGIVFTGIKG